MMTYIIDRQCTVNVQPMSQRYAFHYEGRNYKRRTMESIHQFFLKQPSLDTVKLRLPNEKYYLHLTLDEPEKFTTKKALRRVLAQESSGAWIEKKDGKKRYFVDTGWLFSNIKEMSKEEFFSKSSSSLAQKFTTLISAVALSVLALGSKTPYQTKPGSCVGFVSSALFYPTTAFAQMLTVGEFRINSNMTGNQQLPKISRLEGGGFVTVWHSSQTGDYDIYAKIYDATDRPIGSEFRCNTNVTGTQSYPDVAGLPGGGFVVVWCGDQTGDNDIYAQRYNATGGMAGSEFSCNSNTMDNQEVPAVTGLPGGGFVVVWQGLQTGNYDIYAQKYNATGGAADSEFRCNTNVTGTQAYPAVAGLQSGGFVVVWRGYQTGDYDIYAQKYNATGGAADSEFRCNTNVTSNQWDPAVTGLPGGGFVVVWYGVQTGNYDIYAQRYNATEGAADSEFRCNTNMTSAQWYPAVAGLQDGGFVIVWYGDQTGDYDIYARKYNTTGGAADSEFRCNTNVTSIQRFPDVAGLKDGSFVVGWEGFQNGNDDIYSQRYDASGAPIVSFSMLTTAPSSFISSLAPSATQTSSLTPSFLTNSPNSFSSSLVSPSNELSITTFGSSDSAPQASLTYPSITTLSYETTYSITLNGQDVGTFVFQGGTGLIDGTQSNTITLNIDPSLAGETFTLFTIPAGQEGQFQSIELMGVSCQSFETQVVQDGTAQIFQAIFQGTTCSNAMRSQWVFLKV
ncbi:MAG: hypothetical protein KBA81_02710 [Rhabdochlamydiaceae bacterium]|nr:hypothetical protein [Rhabdochlamydiaceae bacterium]